MKESKDYLIESNIGGQMTKQQYQLILHHLHCAIGHLDRVVTIDPDLKDAPAITSKARLLLEAEAEAIQNLIEILEVDAYKTLKEKMEVEVIQ